MTQRSPQRSSPATASAADDVRCGCGSLLARRRGSAIELKCRRCRRTWLLMTAADGTLTVKEPGDDGS